MWRCFRAISSLMRRLYSCWMVLSSDQQQMVGQKKLYSKGSPLRVLRTLCLSTGIHATASLSTINLTWRRYSEGDTHLLSSFPSLDSATDPQVVRVKNLFLRALQKASSEVSKPTTHSRTNSKMVVFIQYKRFWSWILYFLCSKFESFVEFRQAWFNSVYITLKMLIFLEPVETKLTTLS